MTHQIGADTCNLSVNVSTEERSILGRMACALNVSTGELVRQLVAAGLRLKNPTEAERIERARRQHVINASIMLLIGILMVAVEMVKPSIDLGRARRSRRNDEIVFAMEVEA